MEFKNSQINRMSEVFFIPLDLKKGRLRLESIDLAYLQIIEFMSDQIFIKILIVIIKKAPRECYLGA